MKGKCIFLGDFFQLCPPKKNLEVNLKNYTMGKKHANVMEAIVKNSKVQVHYELGKKGDHCHQKWLLIINLICTRGLTIVVQQVRFSIPSPYYVGVIGDQFVFMLEKLIQ